ncbi:CbiX/SirB N-terminal domain-containing protein [Bremerella sp. JC770]|uniref:CbiX/SirB N-terminal domain-containing protein n=1 Tax=Bremerella sp. JC770 TaxID=3232137 RepID=UPI0034596AFA
MRQSTSNRDHLGIIIVDHGSRRAESNDLLLEVVALFRQSAGYEIVEAAHMELAEPSIADAFQKCVDQGATRIVVHPYFLSPGRHWHEDIPRLAQEAAANHPGITHLVTAPLGLHPLMAKVMQERIETCLAHCEDGAPICEVCTEESSCRLHGE